MVCGKLIAGFPVDLSEYSCFPEDEFKCLYKKAPVICLSPTFSFPNLGWVNLQVGAFLRSREEEQMWPVLICQVAKRKFVSLYLILTTHY